MGGPKMGSGAPGSFKDYFLRTRTTRARNSCADPLLLCARAYPAGPAPHRFQSGSLVHGAAKDFLDLPAGGLRAVARDGHPQPTPTRFRRLCSLQLLTKEPPPAIAVLRL